MRVIVGHNRYSSRATSGENLAVDDEVAWLRRYGVEVKLFERSNDSILHSSAVRRPGQAIQAMWSTKVAADLTAVIARVRPDVVHLHNMFPLFSAAAPAAAIDAGVPVVWTAHNRRLTCVAGSHFRDGQPCYDCRPGWRVPGIVHGCYGDSRAASAAITVGTFALRRASRRQPYLTIANSEYIRHWLVKGAGLDADHVVVKPNGVEEPSSAITDAGLNRNALFAGRLVGYKGVGLLLDAWRRCATVADQLRIVGDGEEAGTVAAAARDDARIRFLGRLSRSQLAEEFSQCRVVIVPSLTEETFGRVAAEAHAHARPVITTGRGALSEIVDATSGWLVREESNSLATELSEALGRTRTADALVTEKGKAGRQRYLRRFTPSVTTTQLLDVYRRAMDLHPRS